ncbi:Hypothetical predicted protein [Pelobates cultripes]|uniref:Uncharacterized protein n=1 Tax=Pelobates cultripes TaxID=61616 RepID=A0AAD1W4N1_PELCU|nr:Hypothetical predicted protein [Pelobates cultripes]
MDAIIHGSPTPRHNLPRISGRGGHRLAGPTATIPGLPGLPTDALFIPTIGQKTSPQIPGLSRSPAGIAATRGDPPEPGGLVRTAGRPPLTRQRYGEANTEATTGSIQGLPRYWDSAATHSRPQNGGRTRPGTWPHTLSTAVPVKQHRHES